MTIPLNTAQKQLVETSMDLVPQMIRSMTRTSAYVSEEEQQELCQIGYLALCRAAARFDKDRPFLPYARTLIRHAMRIGGHDSRQAFRLQNNRTFRFAQSQLSQGL